MRVRVIVPVAFNGAHRVYEGQEFEVPDDMALGSAYERIDLLNDTPSQVKRSVGRPRTATRAADELVV